MSKYVVVDHIGHDSEEYIGYDIRVTQNSELVVVHPIDENKAVAVYAAGYWQYAKVLDA